jgi:cell division protease FtsH
MGQLERAVFRRESACWKALRRRQDELAADAALQPTADSAAKPPGADGRWRLRDHADAEGAHAVAAKIMLAKAVDGFEGVAASIRDRAPVIAIDVADPLAFGLVLASWKETILGDRGAKAYHVDTDIVPFELNIANDEVLGMVVKEPPKAARSDARRRAALSAVAVARPLLAFSPLAQTHLPEPVLRACEAAVTVGPPDAGTVARTIQIVTGERAHGVIEPELMDKIGLEEIALAIRFDRTAADCMERLRRLASDKIVRADGRELSLDEMHGMDEAVAWARSFVQDVEAWRRGELPWSAAETAVCFDGPPGTGKTTLCQVVAKAAGLKMMVCSHARWQSAGEGHLGHFLREMRRDYEEACRMALKEPIVFVCEELDSFADRSSLRHDYRDYSIQATNSLLEIIDSLPRGGGERPRIAFFATTNDARRCDPALLRAGRFGRVIRISHPDHAALEKMMRVRLRGDLAGADLRDLALVATGCTGADVERAVHDARRSARHAGREMNFDDLKRAFAGTAEVPESLRPRIAVHEAAHILVDVLLHGPAGATAVMMAVGSSAGFTFRFDDEAKAGTFGDRFARLQVLLAGRVGETAVFGEASGGAGGAAGSDLERATTEAAAMAGSFGLAGTLLTYFGPAGDTDRMLAYPETRAETQRLLARAQAASARLISRHRTALAAVAQRLLEDGRVDGDQVVRIVAAASNKRSKGHRKE